MDLLFVTIDSLIPAARLILYKAVITKRSDDMIFKNTLKPIVLVASLISHTTFANFPATADRVAFINGNVVSSNLAFPLLDSTVLVEDGKIVKVQPAVTAIPKGYEKVDLDNKWLMPGLIDGHIHLAQSGGAFTRPDMFDAQKIQSYADDQNWLLANEKNILNDYMSFGITSVIDMGGPERNLKRHQQLSLDRQLPTIYAAGPLLAPMAVPKLQFEGKTFIQANSVFDAIEIVKQQLNFNSHIVKLVWTPETGLSPDQLFDLFQPAIALAKQHNKQIAVHVEDKANAISAIKAGADILVHGLMDDPVDDEFITLMKKHDVTYMPTLTAFKHYFELFKNERVFSRLDKDTSSPQVLDSFKTLMNNVNKTDQMFQIFVKYMPYVDQPASEIAALSAQEQNIIQQLSRVFSDKKYKLQLNNLKAILNSEINLGFGTDAGNPSTIHASSFADEIGAWQLAGASNAQIIKAATLGNAHALGLNDTLGSIKPGANADFTVLQQNPLNEIGTLMQPHMVIKNGKIAMMAESM